MRVWLVFVSLLFLRLLCVSLPAWGEPWHYVSAIQKGDQITVTLEDAGDTAAQKRRQTVTYYLEGKALDPTVRTDLKNGIKAKMKSLNEAETTTDVSALLKPD